MRSVDQLATNSSENAYDCKLGRYHCCSSPFRYDYHPGHSTKPPLLHIDCASWVLVDSKFSVHRK